MKNHMLKVYTNEEEISEILDYENVEKLIEIDDKIMIIYYKEGLIEVWLDDIIEMYHDNVEEYMSDDYDEKVRYFYRYEFSLEKYLK